MALLTDGTQPITHLDRHSRSYHITFAASLLLSILLVVALWSQVAHGTLLAWMLAVWLVQGGRVLYARSYLRRRSECLKEHRRWLVGFMLGAMIAGACWGSTFFSFGLHQFDPAIVLLAFTVAGVSAYAGATMAFVFPVVIAFELAAILPMSTWLFLQGSRINIFMGGAALLYLGMRYLQLRQTHAHSRKMLFIGEENEAMAESLRQLKRLERETAMFRNLFEAIADPAVVHDMRDDARIVYANEAACRHFGVDRETALTLHPADFDVKLDREKLEYVADALERDGKIAFETVHRNTSGEELPVEVALSRFDYEGSRLSVSLIRNISARLAVEKRVRELEIAAVRDESNQRMARYLDNAPGYFFTLVHRPDGSYAMPFASRGIQDTFGIEPADVEHDIAALAAVAHPDDVEMTFRLTEESERNLTPYHAEYRILHPQKGERWIECRSMPQREADGSTSWHGFMHDVTGRKRMENELRQREIEFHALAENLPDPVFRYDRDCRRVYVNPAAVRITATPAEQLLGRLTVDCPAVESASAARATAAIREVFATGERREIFVEYLLGDGKISEHQGILVPEFDADGQVATVLAIAHDVTALRESQEQLKAALEFTEGVINAIPDLLFEMDREGRYLNVWTQMPELLAAQKGQLLGRTVHDVMTPEGAVTVMAGLREAEEQGLSFGKIISIALPQGERWFEMSFSRKPGGALSGTRFLVLSRDVTERKQMENELQRRENEFRALAENAPDPIYRYDRDCRRIYVNPAVEKLTGRTLPELLGKSPAEASPVPDVDGTAVQRVIQRVLDTGEPGELEVDFIAANGKRTIILNALVPEFAADGSVQTVLCIGRDITAHKLMEEVLHRSEAEYRTLAVNLPVAVIRYDAAQRRRYLNPAAERMLHGTAAELLGNVPGGPTVPATPAMIEFYRREMEEAMAANAAREFEFVLDALPAERQEHYEVRFAPERGADGKPSGVLAIWYDITGRKAIENALQHSENMLQEAQRIAHVGSWDVDMVNDKLTWSDEIFRVWEIDKTKFKADFAAFLETVHPEDRERVNTVYNEAVVNHTLYEVEHRLLFPDGRIKYILERGEPQYDAQGKPVRFIGTSLDITERKRAESELSESQARYRQVFDNAQEGMFLLDVSEDRRFRVIESNPAFERLIGIVRDDMIGRFVDEILLPETVQKVSAKYNRCIDSGEVYSEEQELQLPVGLHTYHTTLVPVRGDGGRIVRIVGITSDITERKRMELALQASEREFRSLAGNLPDNIARLDTEGRYLYINPTHERTLGMKAADLIGNFIPDSHAQVKAGIRQVVATGQAIHAVRQPVIVDGVEQLHDVSLVPEFDEAGKVISVLGLGRDMTDIYRMQEAIAAREQEFRSLAENLPDNLVRYDREARIVYFNSQFAQVLGVSLDEVAGKTPTQAGMQAGEFFEGKVRQAIATGLPEEFVHQIEGGDGQKLWATVKITPEFGNAGEVVYVQIVSRDITERKRMEEALAEREQEFRSLAESSPDFIIRYDREGRTRYLNSSLVRLLGLNGAEEVIGKRPSETWPDGRFDPIEQAAARAVEIGEGQIIELIGLRESGEPGYNQIFVVPERDSHGGIVGTIAFGRDVTAIRATERKLSHFIDNLPGMAYTFRLSPDGSMGFTYVSQAVEEIFGLTDAEAKADFQTVHTFVPAEDRARIEAAIAVSARDMSPKLVEFRICRPGRPERWLDARSMPERQADGSILWYGLMLDITERKRMEGAIAAREAEFRSLAENSPDAIFRYDREGRRLFVNRTVEEVIGKSRESLVGKSAIEATLNPSIDAVRAHQLVMEVIQTGERRDFETSFIAANGQQVTFLQIYVPEYAADGSVQGALGMGRDITGIKRTEAQLAKERATLRAFFGALPALAWMKDMEGRYLACNPMFEKLYGAREAEILGKTDFDFVDAELASFFRRKDKEAEAAGRPCINEEWVTFAANGRQALIETVKSSVTDAEGKVIGVIGVANDITERRQAELALEENARHLEEQAVELEAAQEQLKLAEAWYRGILHSAPDGMVVVDELGIIRLVNEQLCRMFGYGDGELTGQPVEQLVPLDLREGHKTLRAGFTGSSSQGRPMAGCTGGGLRGRRKDGSEFFIDVSLSRLPDVDGATGTICAAIRDITERRRMEQALAEREQEFRTLIENSADTVARYGHDCRRLYVNPAFAALAEGGAQALIGTRPTEFPGGANADVYEMRLGEVLASGEEAEFELKWADREGREICSLIKLTPEFGKDGGVESVLAVGRDITELNEHRKRIYQMAFYDGLTSLPNRALFNDRLRQMITDAEWHGQKAGVMLLDLDRFKAVNDTLGHPAGDELLREAAARLTGCVRAYDTVARLGGDEFAVLLPEIRSGDDLGVIAGKILQSFGEPFLLEGKEVFVSSSIGIALYPEDGGEADDLIKYADSAMYFAKRSGRNNFRFYSKGLTVSANERLVLEGDLRRGFGRGELELHFQPKVRLADERLVGSEALLRWKHPQRGMVPPDKFISIAEDSGLIVEIGEWVLRTACRTACSWNAPGKPLHKVAVNLSARQFQSGLVDCVRNVLEETGCYPEWVELEITESLLLDEGGEVLDTLNAFRAMGISIAIDDFGTGYSALSYLARYPIDTLKIDRSFTSRLCEYGHHAELVKAIISIARSLGQQVVAEGVETAEEVAVLQSYGCQMVQGYFYGKPMPVDVFADFSAKWVERRNA